MKLRNQIFFLISLLFVAVAWVVFVVSMSNTRQYLEQQLASHAQDAATALSVTLGQSLGRGDLVLAESQVASVFDRGFFKSVEVLGANKSPLLRKDLPLVIEGVPTWFVSRFPIDTLPGEAFIGSGWKQLGKVLVVSQPTMAYQHLWHTSEELFVWLVALCLAAMVMALGVLQLILKPLHAIEKSAINVQAKIFKEIKEKPKAPELARVVVAMNQMSRRVGEMLDAETAKAAALHKQAYEDELTGLVNRRGYELRLNELLLGEQQFSVGAVIAVEVDDMRLLARAHGFAAGEKILRAIADSARSVFAPLPVSLLARSNEYSFSLVSLDLPQAEVIALAHGLQTKIFEALGDDSHLQMVGLHIGVAFFHQQEQRTAVYSRADLALEAARQSDRNGLYVLDFKPDETNALGSFGWRTLIQTALKENRWRVLRQPVMSLADPQMVLQAECMARLVDAQGELVPAAHFMPMAARHRLMPEVDRAMVTLALQYLVAGGEDKGLVAVNLSPQSLADTEFMDWLGVKLAALPEASRLAIEISEFGALRNLPATIRVRDLVRARGGKFGIDHFGLDPKALQLMRDLLPDYVKLAGSMMAELDAVESVSEMLQSFVTLAHSLDVAVIAQQVERLEQLTALNAAAVDAGQGYYFGAPA